MSLTEEHNWVKFGTLTPEQAAAACFDMFDKFLDSQGCGSMIGSIVAFATDELPVNCLPCDGSAQASADYPALYAVLMDNFKDDDPAIFYTPDLRGQVVIGAPFTVGFSDYFAGDSLGDFTHTLTVGELPAHHHTIPTYTNTPLPAGLETETVSSMVEDVGDTGDTGGGSPHSIVQPSFALQYAIVAK